MSQHAIWGVFVCAAALGIPIACLADKVYRWQDDTGVTHYSSQPPAPDAKPHQLPEIMRGEVKVAQNVGFSCNNHGGVNCQAGADEDGSVICFDGFKDASARFRFTCNTPKLEISEVGEVDPDGAFSVFLRNSNSVAANDIKITFSPERGKAVQLEGPAQLEPFGGAEFTYKTDENETPPQKVTLAQLFVSCSNCP